jgi:hypothetical protein
MYTQTLTLEEFNKVVSSPHRDDGGLTIPFLQTFALACAAGLLEEEVNLFSHLITNCGCWHCKILIERPKITAQDVYLRYVLLANYGSTRVALN